MSQKLYTTGDICDFVGVSNKTVLGWVSNGEIKSIRLPGSGLLRFYAEDIVKFCKKHGFIVPEELKEKTH